MNLDPKKLIHKLTGGQENQYKQLIQQSFPNRIKLLNWLIDTKITIKPVLTPTDNALVADYSVVSANDQDIKNMQETIKLLEKELSSSRIIA